MDLMISCVSVQLLYFVVSVKFSSGFSDLLPGFQQPSVDFRDMTVLESSIHEMNDQYIASSANPFSVAFGNSVLPLYSAPNSSAVQRSANYQIR